MAKGGNRLYPLAVALILFIFWLAFPQICSPSLDSPTYDETMFIAEGIYIIHHADFSLALQHPPLAKILIAIPTKFMGLDVPGPKYILDEYIEADKINPIIKQYVEDYPPAQLVRNPYYIGYHLVYDYNRWDADEIFSRCRRVVQLMHYILVLLIYIVARRLFNNDAAIIAAAIALFDPNMVAHGHLCTTDMAAALFTFAAFYMLIIAIEPDRPRWPIVLLWGISLGLMCAAKYSCLLFILIHIGVFIYKYRRNIIHANIGIAIATAAIIITCFIIGGFSFNPYINTIHQLIISMYKGRPSYLLGHYSESGFPMYYLATLLFKMPTGLLVLTVVGIVAAVIRCRSRVYTIGQGALWLTAIIFLISTIIFHSNNLGLRHILVIYPFLILIGVSIIPNATKFSAAKSGAVFLLALFLIESIPAMRDSIPFFNWPCRKAAYDGRLLADSNIDWGQDLGRLTDFCIRNDIRHIHLRYFGTADPYFHLGGIPNLTLDIMGPEYNNAPGPEGWYAVSLQRLLLVRGRAKDPGKWGDVLGWLRETRPYAKVGGSIFIYQYQSRG